MRVRQVCSIEKTSIVKSLTLPFSETSNIRIAKHYTESIPTNINISFWIFLGIESNILRRIYHSDALWLITHPDCKRGRARTRTHASLTSLDQLRKLIRGHLVMSFVSRPTMTAMKSARLSSPVTPTDYKADFGHRKDETERGCARVPAEIARLENGIQVNQAEWFVKFSFLTANDRLVKYCYDMPNVWHQCR